MATGDVVKLGTLYMGSTKIARPTKPWRNNSEPISGYGYGNIQNYSQGATLEIRDTDSNDAYKMQWVEINDGGKKYLVSDRVMLVNISWDDLNAQNLIYGKNITIDGQQYKLRVLTGGAERREGGSGTSYGGGKLPNEWDNWIVNEANLPGLPKPSSTDLDSTLNSTDLNSPHNQKWNWMGVYSWCQETYLHNTADRAGRGYSSARYWNFNYATHRYDSLGWRPVLEVLNSEPTISLSSPTTNQTLYENDTLIIDGSAIDNDADQSVTVYYQINDGPKKVLATNLSQTTIPFNKQLKFKNGKLYDGETAVSGNLTDGVVHTLKVWAQDSEGAMSTPQTRTFYVVPNRAPTLTIEPITPSGNIDTDKFTVTGQAGDPDANANVTVTYRINENNSIQVYEGPGGAFSFDIALGQLVVGQNTIVVEVIDNYGAKTSKTIKLNKNEIKTPLLKSTARFKLEPPAGSAKGVLLYIRRDQNLAIDTKISMTLKGEPENFVPMPKTNTAPMPDDPTILEDEFYYETTEAKDNIIVQVDMERESYDVSDTIILIQGAFD